MIKIEISQTEAHHNLTQYWRGKKIHMSRLDRTPRKFSITLIDKYVDQLILILPMKTYMSTTNKRIICILNRRIFYINQNNQLTWTSMNYQPSYFPRPSYSPRENTIRMYGLDMYHRKFDISPEDKYQDQLTLTRSMKRNNSITNNVSIKNKTQKESALEWTK